MIEVVDRTGLNFDKKDLLGIKKQTKVFLDFLVQKKSQAYQEVNVVLLGEEEIKSFNQQYLKKNHATDVLTFTYGEDEHIHPAGLPIKSHPTVGRQMNSIQKNKTLKAKKKLSPLSGDVLLCPKKILYYAFQDCLHPVMVFYETLLHGLLHLYGLEHDYSEASLKKVYRQQKNILKQFKLNEVVVYGIFKKLIQK